MTTTSDSNQYTFQAEIKQLLQLLSHSLYQNKEIAIRELVSNASDALDKLRHVSLTNDDVSDAGLEISIEPNKDDRVLVIRDNGIGMTQEELVQNLGTIAHSGSLDFINKLSGDKDADLSLIGQFGVGFYSAFMLADNVEVLTRSWQEKNGWRWQSSGDGSFTIDSAEGFERGTQIRLHLKKDLDEFTEETRLKYILKKYSTFVPHPIKLDGEHINDQPPIWVEPKSSLKDEDYNNFYQYLSHGADEKPLWHLHLSADSPFQFYSILFCPQANYEKMGFARMEHGLHLCAKRILVQNDNTDLLPEYLRFIHGLVDSSDLPLNVSREALQDNTVFRKMRKVLVKRVLDFLAKMADEESDKYSEFYERFGNILREGISVDFENRDRIARLLRFESSHSADGVVSLDEYIERAGDEQKQIYFLGGVDRAAIERNPNLEVFRSRKVEVLYLTDPIDEFVLNQLGKYEDHDICSIDSADAKLPDADDDGESNDESKSDEQEVPSGFEHVLTLFREALGDTVSDVRKSDRLTESTCCLVNPEGAMSTQMQKVMQLNTPDYQLTKLILEINPQAPLVKRLSEISANTDNGDFIRECGRQLYSNALIVSGLAPSADEMQQRVEGFMKDLAQTRSSIAM